MLRKLFLALAIAVSSGLHAEIVEITQIDEIRPYATEDSLSLFDIDDTLIDNRFSLGTCAWRNWVKTKLSKYETKFVLYDALTLFIAQAAPYKTVEPTTAALIHDLQIQGHAVFGFTARGRSQWYTTDIEGVDLFTYRQLKQVGIDFKETRAPEGLQRLDSAYFCDGIIFARHIKKGDLLKRILRDLQYRPSLIIFVDDRLDQMQSVEAALAEIGIPFIGFWYRRSEIDRQNFDPRVANVQLEALLQGEVMSDETAAGKAKNNSDEFAKFHYSPCNLL